MPIFKTRDHTEIYYKDWLLHRGDIAAVECYDRHGDALNACSTSHSSPTTPCSF